MKIPRLSNTPFGGTITLGSGVEDDVTFVIDVASNIVPDVDNFYIFGRDTGLDSTTQRLGDTTVDPTQLRFVMVPFQWSKLRFSS